MAARDDGLGAPTTIVVGEGNNNGQTQALTMIHAPKDSFALAGSGIDSAKLTAPAGFTQVSCSFTTARLGDDAEQNFACDLTTKITDVFSGQGSVSFGGKIATCASCDLTN